MKNQGLQTILDTYSSKPNKELANMLINLESDFNELKKTIVHLTDTTLELTDTLGEVEMTYNTIYSELQKRLKFKDES